MSERSNVEMKIKRYGTPETDSDGSSITSARDDDAVAAAAAAAPNDEQHPKLEFVTWSDLSRSDKYGLVGWILFIACAMFYLVAAIPAAVQWATFASIGGTLLFLVACFAFLVPMLWKEKQPQRGVETKERSAACPTDTV